MFHLNIIYILTGFIYVLTGLAFLLITLQN